MMKLISCLLLSQVVGDGHSWEPCKSRRALIWKVHLYSSVSFVSFCSSQKQVCNLYKPSVKQHTLPAYHPIGGLIIGSKSSPLYLSLLEYWPTSAHWNHPHNSTKLNADISFLFHRMLWVFLGLSQATDPVILPEAVNTFKLFRVVPRILFLPVQRERRQ